MSVVQLSDMLAHLNLTAGLDDTLIQAKIDAAEKWIETFTGLALLTQARTVHFDRFHRLELPVRPVQSITSVSYLDNTLTSQTLAPDSYVATPLNSEFDPTYLCPASGTRWPSTGSVKSAVTVTVEAGYGSDGANVPAPLVEAIKALVAHWYENREAALVGITASELPFGLGDVLNQYRAWSF